MNKRCSCGAEFKPVTANQTDCTQCMIKPLKNEPAVPAFISHPLPSEAPMNVDVAKTKTCITCGKEYAPTTNAQKFCVECGKKRAAEMIKKPASIPQPPIKQALIDNLLFSCMKQILSLGCDQVALQYENMVINFSLMERK